MLQEALKLAKAGEEESDADLFEELRIPSVSALPQHREDVRRNARWLADRMERLGFKTSLNHAAGARPPPPPDHPVGPPNAPPPPACTPHHRPPARPRECSGRPPLSSTPP